MSEMQRLPSCLALSAMLALAGLTGAQTANFVRPVDPQQIRTLIVNLGNAKFSVRDRAARDLEAVGGDALEPLRQAIQAGDAEVSSRAAKLVARIEHKLLTDALLAPKKARLNVKDMAVTEAVAELARLTGCTIEIAGERALLAERKITLDTGEVSFWEAFEKLCQAGGLAEDRSIATRVNEVAGGYVPVQPTSLPRRSIVVTGGTADKLPVSLAGSVRVQALRPQVGAAPIPTGEMHLVLDVGAETRLLGFGIVGSPILDKAIDEHGRTLSIAPMPLPANPPAMDMDPWAGRAVGRAVIVNGVVVRRNYAAMNTPPTRTVTLRLKRGDKEAKSLKEITGKVSVQVVKENEKFASIKDVFKSAGQNVAGPDGSRIQITSVEKLTDGSLALDLSIGNLPGQAMPIRARGKFAGNFNNALLGDSTNIPKLLDNQGKMHTGEVVNLRTTVNNNSLSQHVTVVYRPEGAPAEFAFYGQRVLVIDVPFSFKNMPLP